MSGCIYAGMMTAKNGTEIPVFTNNRTFFSTYNPERDAEAFITANQDNFSNAGFILVGGIGNGLHVLKLCEKFPEAKIVVFEADEPSLFFSLNHLVKPLAEKIQSSESRIMLTSTENLKTVLSAHYIPALHGNFAFASVRSWADFLGNTASSFIQTVNGVLADISQDYSVQAQFGKLWHRNILQNIALYDILPEEQKFNPASFKASQNARKAAIIGAGPSLDNTIHILSENRSGYCIFATDTTYGTLRDAGITPDFVVTVDSQHLSAKHFIGHTLDGTILAGDLTANTSIIEYAVKNGAQILLFHNNHPLSQLIENWIHELPDTANPFPFIDSGAGTVLHAATDLARKIGFTEIEYFGADFSYSEGKPYTKGTYLEKLYYSEENRIWNAESSYSRLMYRTPLTQLSENVFTTEILLRYKKALESSLQQKSPDLLTQTGNKKAVFSPFLSWYLDKLQKKDKKSLISVLPLAAWYKKNFPDADTECVYAFAEEQTANVGRIQCRLQKK